MPLYCLRAFSYLLFLVVLFTSCPSYCAPLKSSASLMWRSRFNAVRPSVCHTRHMIFSCLSGKFVALNSSTGKTIWSDTNSDCTRLAFDDDTDILFIAGSDAFYAVDGFDVGRLLWTAPVTNGFTPTITPDYVYVGSDDTFFYCLDKITGQLRWKWRSPGEAGIGRLTFDGVRTMFGSTMNSVFALDAFSSEALWQTAVPGPSSGTFDGTPAVGQGMVFVGQNENTVIQALNATNGKLMWEINNTDASFYARPMVHNGVLYLGSNRGTMYAIWAANGRMLWSSKVSSQQILSAAYVWSATNELLFMDGTTNVYALNAYTGKTHWTFNVGSSSGSIFDGMAFSEYESRVYVATDSSLSAISLTS